MIGDRYRDQVCDRDQVGMDHTILSVISKVNRDQVGVDHTILSAISKSDRGQADVDHTM